MYHLDSPHLKQQVVHYNRLLPFTERQLPPLQIRHSTRKTLPARNRPLVNQIVESDNDRFNPEVFLSVFTRSSSRNTFIPAMKAVILIAKGTGAISINTSLLRLIIRDNRSSLYEMLNMWQTINFLVITTTKLFQSSLTTPPFRRGRVETRSLRHQMNSKPRIIGKKKLCLICEQYFERLDLHHKKAKTCQTAC